MPRLKLPGNDLGRIAFLNSSLNAAGGDKKSGKTYILDDTHNKLQSLAPAFENKVTNLNQYLASRTKEISERNNALYELSMYTRDGFEVARRQVRRLKLPAQVLQLYGLPLDGKTPNPTRLIEWIVIAKTFVAGAKKAKEKGFPGIQCPSPEETKEKLVSAEKEFHEVAGADRSYDDAQQEVADMRAQANELIQDIIAELRMTLRKLDRPSKRRIMRSYGARFQYLKGETVDPDDEEPIIDKGIEEASN
jgi:hypothetical protein